MSLQQAPQPQIASSPLNVLLSRPVLAALTAAALTLAAYLVPATRDFQLFSSAEDKSHTMPAASDSATAPVGSVRLVSETEDHPELALPEVAPASSIRTKPPPRPIEDASGHALDRFFLALRRVDQKQSGAVARVLHYGDSLLAIDYVSSTLRRQLQEQFGDGGHGYMPIANPTPGYFHNDVSRRASDEWLVSRVVGPFAPDGLYGLGGVSFIGQSRGSWARYATTAKGSFGRSVSRFGMHYLAQPGGGTFEVLIDGKAQEPVSTNAESAKLAKYETFVTDGEHAFELRVTRGPVRAFGAWMDRDGPGVIVDSVGIQGARLRFLDQSDDGHWAEALRSRHPDLVILEFGLNEAADDFAYPMERYKETAIKVLQQVRDALPGASCLMVSPNDVAIKKGTEITSRRIVDHLVKAQREVSEKTGCAFFDVYQAMGGFGSMPLWIRKGLGGPDYTHPTTTGADTIGIWLYRALMDRYASWHPPAAEEPSTTPSPSAAVAQ